MKPETLNALLMDRELGELSPESAELLDAYLTATPDAQFEADAVARTIHTACETVRRFPGLAPIGERNRLSRMIQLQFLHKPWLVKAAAIVAAAGTCAWLGYRAGISATGQDKGDPSGERAAGALASAESKRFEGLWTHYQVAYDDQRKSFAVAVTPQNHDHEDSPN